MYAPSPRRDARRLPVAAAAALAAGLLAALIQGMATVPASTTAPVGPLAAPQPAGAVVDFPEQARPGAACAAILERSSAVGNARSERAGAITGVLLQDACSGA